MSSQFPLVDPNQTSAAQWLQRDFASTSPVLGGGSGAGGASSSSSSGGGGLSSPYFLPSNPAQRHQLYQAGSGRGGMTSGLLGSGDARVLEPQLQPQMSQSPAAPLRKGYFEQLAGVGLGVGNLLAENILSHPFIVLRRQCQVNHSGSSYHVTPFTLFPPVLGLQQNQGVLCLWKGVTSSFVVQGITHKLDEQFVKHQVSEFSMEWNPIVQHSDSTPSKTRTLDVLQTAHLICLSFATETILADLLGLPREVSQNADVAKALKHMLLKSVTFFLMTPFMAAALKETVQSDVASERPGLLDCLRDGVGRVMDVVGPRDSSRKIPLWILLPPTITYRLSHYIISGLTHYVTHAAVKKHVLRRPSAERTVFDDFFPDLFAAFSSHLLADAILFPIETVLNRLYLQGTRTIIDNLDKSESVVPVSTRYEGVIDCVRCIQRGEGWLGFYKGFGALCFQYAVHYAILRGTRVLFERLEDSLRQQQNVSRQPGLPPWPVEVERF